MNTVIKTKQDPSAARANAIAALSDSPQLKYELLKIRKELMDLLRILKGL